MIYYKSKLKKQGKKRRTPIEALKILYEDCEKCRSKGKWKSDFRATVSCPFKVHIKYTAS